MSTALYSVLIKPGFRQRLRQLAGISLTIGIVKDLGRIADISLTKWNEDSGRIAGISSLNNLVFY